MPTRITFSGGQTENVYSVPPYLTTDLTDLPQYRVEAEDTPEIAIEKHRGLEAAQVRAALKYAFQDTKVPRGWKFPQAALQEGLTPDTAEGGRLVDYVKYTLLASRPDWEKAQNVMQPLTQEEVASAEATFCSRVRCPFRR